MRDVGLGKRLWGWLDKVPYRFRLRARSDLILPSFLGIGAQKAGTTWLHQNLRHHPQIFFPEVAPPRTTEVHYFDVDFHLAFRSYADLFASAGTRIPGDITPAYSIIDTSRIRFVRTVMPNVKLILLLRDPIERAWSHAVMNLVTERSVTLDDVSEAAFISHFKSRRSRRRGDSLNIIERWLSEFPREQLFVGWFEDIAHAPEDLLRGVFRHIGASDAVDLSTFPFSKKFNAGGGWPLPGHLRSVLEDLYASEIEGLARRFPDRATHWLNYSRQ